MEQQRAEQVKELETFKAQNLEKQHEMNKDLIITKKKREKTVLQEKVILGMSFNPDLDANTNKVNDFLEINKNRIDNITTEEKNKLERDKFEYQN